MYQWQCDTSRTDDNEKENEMPPKLNRKLMKRMEEAFNTGNLALVDELVAPDHVDRTPFPGTGRDRNGLKKQITALRKAFPDGKFRIVKMVAEGEAVAYSWKLVGTQKGPLLGRDATNKKITFFGNGFVTFKDGKMIGHEATDDIGGAAAGKDVGGMLTKLGYPAEV